MAFFQTGGAPNERFLNAPPSVLWLIGAIMVAHTVRAMLAMPQADNIVFDYAFIPAYPTDALTYVSYLFLHGSFLHAGINSLWLLAFGPPVAWRLGTVRFLAFYFLCGIAAALAHLVSDWGSMVPVVGASGAISGQMGGAIRILYAGPTARWGQEPRQLAPIYSKPVLFFATVWLAVNLVVGVIGLGLTEDGEVIAWVAHMGGFFAGFLGIGLIDPAKKQQDVV
nr:MAG: rhomboid family intramembrane serine protease [Hyphomicrobiales bacterium]